MDLARPMPPELQQAAEAAKGFMPPAEGLALYQTDRKSVV